jgi:MFS family permease
LLRVKPRESTPVDAAERIPEQDLRRAVPVYALVFAAGVMQSALAPLGPVYAADLHLSHVEVGALFAAASVTMVLVALPIGVVTDRLGPRRLTIAAGLLVAVSAVVQGLARNFWLLLGARGLFGVAFGAVWTAGPALIVAGGAGRRRSALGAVIPVAGASQAVGPAFAGIAAARFGLAVPFVAIAVAAAAATGGLVLAPGTLAPDSAEPLDVRTMLRAARDNPLVLGAAAMMAAGGFSMGVASLLVPLRLRSNGVSVGAIGTVFGVAALVYLVGGLAAGRAGRRLVTPRAAGAAVLALGVTLVLPALGTATWMLVLFLLARSACTAVTSTIAYPLASASAAATGLGAGAAIGLVNAAWATSTVVGPLVGGAVSQAAGDRLVFALLVPFVLAVGAWLLRLGGRQARAPLGEARSHR